MDGKVQGAWGFKRQALYCGLIAGFWAGASGTVASVESPPAIGMNAGSGDGENIENKNPPTLKRVRSAPLLSSPSDLLFEQKGVCAEAVRKPRGRSSSCTDIESLTASGMNVGPGDGVGTENKHAPTFRRTGSAPLLNPSSDLFEVAGIAKAVQRPRERSNSCTNF